jgi:periplasmic divalent cation tolerance protein
MSETDIIVILCPCPSTEVAQTILRTLLEARLIACGHIPAAGQSLYRWEGKIEQSAEVYALLKTQARHYTACEAAIKRLHPYEVPCIIALPVGQGDEGFLTWVKSETA